LLKEVSHRSKNLLAMVQSVAFQTARHSDSLDRFIERFRGRIQSLSYSQDAITQTDWQGSKISALVQRQKSLFSPVVQKLIQFEGDDILLSPNATMHLGLALHELIANATNYGQFIEKNQPIKIVSSPAITAEDDEIIAIEWSEHSAHDPFAEAKEKKMQDKQFGSILLEKIVPTALSGKAQFVRDGEQLKYRIEFPKGA
jgi:two-component sensor histidine kinase